MSSMNKLSLGRCCSAPKAASPGGSSPRSQLSKSRRCLSDSSLRGVTASSKYGQNTKFMMINRSGGSTVKKIIPAILSACSNALIASPPEEECYILAQWAVDSYYKVVIAGNGGVHALMHAMKAFPLSQGLQESCCLALGNLCKGSESNRLAASAAGAVGSIVSSMKLFPTSISVQSAACSALRHLPIVAEAETASELIEVFTHAKTMCLHPTHRRSAEHLLAITLQQRRQLQDPRW